MLTILLGLPLVSFAHPDADPPSPPPAPPVAAPAKKEDPPPDVDWSVDAPHGPTHEVALDLREATWVNVAVQGDRIVFDVLGDLWSIPVRGGDAVRLTQGPAWDAQPAFSPDGTRIAFVSDRGGNEQLWTMNADGSNPRPFTDEAVARVTEPVWDAEGRWLYGRRRTVDQRSIGVTEIWAWHLDGGAGIPLTSKDDRPHAGELVASDARYFYFSSRNGRFEYNQDPVGGLWEIHRRDRRTGQYATVAYGPGSASRPSLSPDGRTLVFVTRDRTATLLEAMDLATGRRRVLADWLSPDEMEGFALHGTYPGMDWTDDGDLVLWAQGKLWRLGLDGKRAEIPFHVQGAWTVADVVRPTVSVPEVVTARVLRWATRSARGATAFSAMGQLYVQTPEGTATRIGAGTGYAPAWSPSGLDLAWTSWDDEAGGRLHVTAGKGFRTVDLPVEGQLTNPAWSEDGKRLVALRAVGGSVSAELAEASAFEIVSFSRSARGSWALDGVVTTLPNPGSANRAPKLHLHDGRVWYAEERPNAGDPRMPGDTMLVSIRLDGVDPREHLLLPGSQEVAISPDFRWVAYKRAHQLWLTAMPPLGVVARVTDDQLPTRRVTQQVGDWIGWAPGSDRVTWVSGTDFHTLPIAGAFDPDAVKDPPAEPAGLTTDPLTVVAPRARPTGVVALTHARVITMRGAEVLEDTTVVLDGDRIAAIGGPVPAGAEVLDCTGKTVIPGLIDVHAHLHYDTGDILPEQQWEYLTALDFGVTTVHDPSASTDTVFTQAERVEAGLALGPRVYSTGYILYGAFGNDATDAPDPASAARAVARMAGYGAHSVKVYQQSQRARRQWFVAACASQGVLCVPEGGGDLYQNLGMVVDGFPVIEHALPTAPLYADVVGLFAGSGTAAGSGTFYTPTLLVAYGGLSGEHWYYQHASPVDDARLQRHFPRRQLDAQAWRRGLLAQDGDWRHEAAARDAARLQEAGVPVTLGAHGQIQGIGVHWELWSLAGPGAMSPHEALRAATLDGARYLGLGADLGSIEVGKLADLVVLDANPLDDIHHSDDIAWVIKNGVRYGSQP